MPSNENDTLAPERQINEESDEPTAWAFVGPFLVFMVLINFYPSFEISVEPGEQTLVDPGKATTYTVLVALQVVVLERLVDLFSQNDFVAVSGAGFAAFGCGRRHRDRAVDWDQRTEN